MTTFCHRIDCRPPRHRTPVTCILRAGSDGWTPVLLPGAP